MLLRRRRRRSTRNRRPGASRPRHEHPASGLLPPEATHISRSMR